MGVPWHLKLCTIAQRINVAQSHNSIYSWMHLHGDPSESFRIGVGCSEHLKHVTCSAKDVAVMRVRIGVSIQKTLKVLAHVKE